MTRSGRPERASRAGPRRWIGRLAAVLVGLLLPLLLLEAAFRWIGPVLPGNYDTGAYLVRHGTLGHFHVPGFSGWIKAPEFTTQVTISPLGLRDRRQSYEKPPGTYRILLLGDSFVEAVQVAQRDALAERLEALLNDDPTRPVEVINAGVAAYGTGQQLLLLEQVGVRFQPDLVVLLFFVGNDLTNNNYRLELWDGDIKLALKPYFDLNQDGTLRLIPGPPPLPRDGFVNLMRRNVVLWNVFETGVANKLNQNYPREQLEAVGGLRTPLSGLYDTELNGEWLRAWTISELLLARIRDRAAQAGAPFVVVGAPEWRTLEPDAWAEEIRKSNPRSNRLASGRLTIDAPTSNLGAVAQRLGVPYVDLLPALQAAYPTSKPLYYEFDKHWTANGHAVAAATVAQELRRLGLAEVAGAPTAAAPNAAQP